MRARFALLALCASLLPACLGNESVVRVVDGEVHEGRFIAPSAYAAYGEGALLEAAGRDQEAEAAYVRAAESDGDSAEIWTRIGALRCRARRAGAAGAFARAEALDDSYAPLWLARARCAVTEARQADALRLAERALALDPDAEDTSLVLASIYDRAGRADAAGRLLAGLVARDPRSQAAWRALLDHARARGDAVAARQATSALEHLAPAAPGEATSGNAVDAALHDGGLAAARRAALASHIAPGELALRAVAEGMPGLAIEQARSVLAADPDDPDARMALLFAGDLAGDQATVARSLEELSRKPVAPGKLAAELMAELLQRRIGTDATRAWQAAYGPTSRKTR